MVARQSPPAREAWIEIVMVILLPVYYKSPPAREAWIEIDAIEAAHNERVVASREGGVD